MTAGAAEASEQSAESKPKSKTPA